MADFTAELQSTNAALFMLGDTSTTPGSRILPPGITKQPTVRSQSMPRGNRHGITAGADRYDQTVLTIPVEFYAATPEEVQEYLQLALDAWQLDEDDDGNEVELRTIEPGDPYGAHMRWFGKPKPPQVDPNLHRWSRKLAVFTFVATDPLMYGPYATNINYPTSPATVPNAGTMSTDRVVITINGNGGTPVLTNSTDGDGDLIFAAPLAGGDEYVVDLHAETVVDGAGNNMMNALWGESLWFKLRPGNNTIVYSGCASIDVAVRAAYPPGA